MHSSAAAVIKGRPGQTRKPGIFGTAVGAFGVTAIMGVLAVVLQVLGQRSPHLGPGYSGWAEAAAESPVAAARWLLGDMTEPLFYKSDLAALGLLAGAGLSWWIGRRRGRVERGRDKRGGGLGPWILASASLSLLLSNLAFGWMLDDGWQPTFVPFVCVAPAMVILYGPGWRTCITGAVLGAATVTPLALIFIPTVASPLACRLWRQTSWRCPWGPSSRSWSHDDCRGLTCTSRASNQNGTCRRRALTGRSSGKLRGLTLCGLTLCGLRGGSSGTSRRPTLSPRGSPALA